MRTFSVAWKLALNDIKLSYRRSTLGPLWSTATFIAQISVIGLLFSRLFDSDTGAYLLHFGSGFIAWAFVVGSLNDSATSLTNAGTLIKQVQLPIAVHVLRSLNKNFIQFGHNLLALIPFFFVAQYSLGFSILLALPGLALTLANLGWLSIILAVISARYRDFPAIVSGGLVVAFYVTPILWSPKQIEGSWVQQLIPFNPFVHLIDVFRAPLIGSPIPTLSFIILLLSASIGWSLSYSLLKWKSAQIPFWV